MRRLIRQGEHEINHILSGEDEILPSSGFAVTVMHAVRRQAAAPPPIPFPWKRALPGLLGAGLAVALILAEGVMAIARFGRTSATAQSSSPLPSLMPLVFHGRTESAAIWAALALLVTLVSVKFSMRLATDRAQG
jgi:hypothetical protein